MAGQDSGVTEWVEETTAFERVRGVITTVSEPCSVEWVADEAAVSIEDSRDTIEKLQSAGIIRPVGDTEERVEPVPDTQLEVTKRAVRDSFDEEELRGLRDELAAEVISAKRTDTTAVCRLMAVEECITDIEEGR